MVRAEGGLRGGASGVEERAEKRIALPQRCRMRRELEAVWRREVSGRCRRTELRVEVLARGGDAAQPVAEHALRSLGGGVRG